MLAHVLLLLLAAVQAQPATPPRDAAAPKSGSASLSGLVTEQDSNRPLHRAVVTLVPFSGPGHREALTDVEGRYEFVGLEPGEYGVVATAGDLRATHLRQAFDRSAPLDLVSSPPRSGVKLEPGERRTGVNIALARALAIEGRVLDPWDEPMAEVQIALTRADGTPYPSFGMHSDDRGDYRVFGLAPGRYRVCAAPQSSADVSSDASRFVRTCHPAAVAEGDAADVLITTSDAAGIDIRVQRSGTFTVSGTVADAAGALVDAPRVTAVPLDRRVSSAYARGSGGLFVLRGLMPGRYLIRASVGGSENRDDTRPPAREEEVGYASVDVEGMDVAGTIVQLSKGRTVSGRIAFEGGSPPPASQLRMAVHAGVTNPHVAMTIGHRRPVSAVSDTLTFELKGLDQLPMAIAVTGLPDGWVIKSVRLDGLDVTGLPTNFGVSAKPGLLEILATSRVARPAVRVTDERGNPLSSYNVVLFSTDEARWKMPSAPIPGPPTADGVVKLGAILPGEYLVAALTLADYFALANDVTRFSDLASVAARATFVEGDTRTVGLHMTPLPAAKVR